MLDPPEVMVIVASPAPAAVTSPVSSTDATSLSDEVYVTGSSANSSGSSAGESWIVLPMTQLDCTATGFFSYQKKTEEILCIHCKTCSFASQTA